MTTHYFIKADNGKETGVLAQECGAYWITDILRCGEMFSTEERAVETLERILNEKPTKMADGSWEPGSNQYRIANLSNTRRKAVVRLAVIAVDIENETICTAKWTIFTVDRDLYK